MAIDRWTPLRDFDVMREAMDRFVHDTFVRGDGASLALDIAETDDGYQVHASLPGFKPEEVKIHVEGNRVSIRAEHRADAQHTEGKRWIVRERRTSAMSRSIELPGMIDAEKAQATFENGELTLRLQRAASSKPKEIPITTVSTQPATNGVSATEAPAKP